MSNEAETGSAGAPDHRGHRGGSGADGSPLQTRAAFIQNWNWESIVSLNGRTCSRSGAQHGINTETGETCAAEWEEKRHQKLTLAETFDFLFHYRKSALMALSLPLCPQGDAARVSAQLKLTMMGKFRSYYVYF